MCAIVLIVILLAFAPEEWSNAEPEFIEFDVGSDVGSDLRVISIAKMRLKETKNL